MNVVRFASITIAAASLCACGTRRMTVTPARAGDVPPGQRYPAALLAHFGDSIAVARSTGYTFRNEQTYKIIEGRRWENGGPEVHDDWTDIMYVQAGRATVLTGGHLEGSRLDSPGEHRGGTIVGGTRQTVTAGDMFVIPAGTPHQSYLAAGDSIRYITVKVPAGR